MNIRAGNSLVTAASVEDGMTDRSMRQSLEMEAIPNGDIETAALSHDLVIHK